MSERRHRHVVNVDEIEARTMTKGRRFGATRERVGPLVGARGLGCTHDEVEPANPGDVAALGTPSSEAAMKGQHWIRFLTREGASLDYYDGEDEDG